MKLFYKYTLIFFAFGVSILFFSVAIFYYQFKSSLVDRTKEQLKSVNALKRDYIERFIASNSKELSNIGKQVSSISDLIDKQDILKGQKTEIIFSQKKLHPKTVNFEEYSEGLSLTFPINDTIYLERKVPISSFHDVLLKRIGMGTTGESYIVGEDYKMRTASRFIDDSPYNITVKTKGTKSAFKGIEGSDQFPDYRDIIVLSAFSKIEFGNVRWVILSEIDLSETLIPLEILKRRLLTIISIILLIVTILSLLLSKKMISRIIALKQSIQLLALGQLPEKSDLNIAQDEIDSISIALNQLIDSFEEAILFAKNVSKGDFNSTYTLQSNEDELGLALTNMQKKLKRLTLETEKLEKRSKKALIAGQEKERARLAKDIHDGIGPLLTTIKLALESKNSVTPESIEQTKAKIDETIAEVRNISFNLMPPILLDFGVGAAVQKLVDSINTDIDIRFINDIAPNSKLTDELNISIYRIIQESLNNSLKHADPGEIKISITEFEDQVSVFYSDDGIGFDFEGFKKKKKDSKGLINIQERVRVLNGDFQLESDMTGTRIEIELPFVHE